MLVDTRKMPERVIFDRRALRILILAGCWVLLLLLVPGLFSSDLRVLAISAVMVPLMIWMMVTIRSYYRMVADQNGIRACRPFRIELRLAWRDVHALAVVSDRNQWGIPLAVVAARLANGDQVLLTQVAQQCAPEDAGMLHGLIEAMEQVQKEALPPSSGAVND